MLPSPGFRSWGFGHLEVPRDRSQEEAGLKPCRILRPAYLWILHLHRRAQPLEAECDGRGLDPFQYVVGNRVSGLEDPSIAVLVRGGLHGGRDLYHLVLEL